jgi:hypothetical protein
VVGRATALLALFGGLVVYYETSSSLWHWGLWGSVAWISCVLIPVVFLLKFGPQAQELQEGVAFHGRAGSALIKSLQRLHVDAMEVYGTNCAKFAGSDLGVAAEWLRRELRIVEPKLVVVMGEDALEFLNGVDFQLSAPLRPELGELQRFSPTIEGLYVPDIDLSLDEGPAKTAFWNAFKAVGPWWAELPPY